MFNGYDLRLKNPFNSIICGPSGSGKTILMYKLLRQRNELFTNPPQKVFYFYNEWQETYNNMKEEYDILLDKITKIKKKLNTPIDVQF